MGKDQVREARATDLRSMDSVRGQADQASRHHNMGKDQVREGAAAQVDRGGPAMICVASVRKRTMIS
jgi:hypothetical protein